MLRARAAAAKVAAVGVLALAVMFGPGTPQADAIGLPTFPVSFGASLDVPVLDAIGPEACMANVTVCVGVLALGAGLYAAKDSWMPVVSGAFSKAYNFLTGSGGSCGATASATLYQDGFDLTASYVQGNVCGGLYNYNGDSVSITRIVCQAPGAPATVQTPSNYPTRLNNSSSGGHLTQHVSVCSPGLSLVGVVFTFLPHGETSIAAPQVSLGSSVPSGAYSQTTTVTCTSASSANLISEATTVMSQIALPSCAAAYPGSVPTHVTMTGGLAGAERPILDTDLAARAVMMQKYPGCFDASGAFLNTTCKVQVYINGQPCTQGATHCGQWSTAAADYGDTVTCQYGGVVVDMGNCSPLVNSYIQGAPVTTLTTVDAQGVPTDQNAPGAVPNTDPGTAPGPATNPDSSDCWGNGWSLNALADIAHAIECSYKWAFVPTATSLNSINVDWTTVKAWLPPLPDPAEGCGPITWNMPSTGLWQGRTVSVADTCSEPYKDAAAWVKGIVTAGLIAAFAWDAYNVVSSALWFGRWFGTKYNEDGQGMLF